jgi:hypothetical protein
MFYLELKLYYEKKSHLDDCSNFFYVCVNYTEITKITKLVKLLN